MFLLETAEPPGHVSYVIQQFPHCFSFSKPVKKLTSNPACKCWCGESIAVSVRPDRERKTERSGPTHTHTFHCCKRESCYLKTWTSIFSRPTPTCVNNVFLKGRFKSEAEQSEKPVICVWKLLNVLGG